MAQADFITHLLHSKCVVCYTLHVGRLDFDLFSPILMKPSERLLLHVKKIMSKFRSCGTISSPCTFALKFKILLRKGPQKIFPHHFFSCGPVIIWTCWCEKNTWKIEKSSISMFYEFFIFAKNDFDEKKNCKNYIKIFFGI